MPPAANYARVVYSGYLNGGEIWNTGFSVGTLPGALTQDLADAIADAANKAADQPAFGGFMRIAAGNIWAPSTIWASTKVYLYAGSGSAVVVAEKFTNPQIPGTAGQVLPNQCCLVVSLRTGAPGRRNRGRMYLPATGGPLGNDAEVAGPKVTAVSAAVALGLSRFNDAGVGNPAVVSQVGGTIRRITQVVTDSRIDIQRRRANRENVTFTQTNNVGEV